MSLQNLILIDPTVMSVTSDKVYHGVFIDSGHYVSYIRQSIPWCFHWLWPLCQLHQTKYTMVFSLALAIMSVTSDKVTMVFSLTLAIMSVT